MNHQDTLLLIKSIDNLSHIIDVDFCCIIAAMFIIFILNINDIFFGKK
jgi:hypothetical protein